MEGSKINKTDDLFAMKEMLKSRVLAKRSVASVMNERKLLSGLKHDFIVNMHYAFQDRENLYVVLDLFEGGDLRYHLSRHRRLTENQTKFLIGWIIIALEYIHGQGILHRDIKPENLVMDTKGYLAITDFGIAKIWSPDNKKDTSGTPGYMAPEVMWRQNHGVAADYFAVGVIAFEWMFGKRPYRGKDRKEIRENILMKQIKISKSDIPSGWSLEAADFVNRLIQRKPVNRLGLNGPDEVKSHVWFKDFDWESVLGKTKIAPFIPPNGDNFDFKYANDSWKDENSDIMK